MSAILIRPIKKEDNPFLKEIIRSVILEMGAPKIGTAYSDPAVDCMFETFQKERTAYFVVEENGQVIGGAGVAKLGNYEGNVCELQKMYFLEQARGKGIGSKMMEKCLEVAKEFGFEKCYLETMTYMEAAQKLYKRSGFDYIDGPLGDTGHFSCPVQMLKQL
jgi:putative acetyltransferase